VPRDAVDQYIGTFFLMIHGNAGMTRIRTRKGLIWLLVALWLGYSAAVLGWHAATLPPGSVCVAR
jgi:hypothetical protein